MLMRRESMRAEVTCGVCRYTRVYTNVPSVFEKVDVYNRFIDDFHERGVLEGESAWTAEHAALTSEVPATTESTSEEEKSSSETEQKESRGENPHNEH